MVKEGDLCTCGCGGKLVRFHKGSNGTAGWFTSLDPNCTGPVAHVMATKEGRQKSITYHEREQLPNELVAANFQIACAAARAAMVMQA